MDGQMDGQTDRKTGQKMGLQMDQTPWERLGNKFTLGLRTRTEAEWLPVDDAFGDAGRRQRLHRRGPSCSATPHP